VKIGKNCLVYSNVIIREGVEIGDDVIIHSGAVIGADGFGFTRDSNGIPIKIPQKGSLIVGNGCEIGANTCIDRSTIEETVLNSHVKLDNLVQIGHNVTIGSGTAISSQTGISGSTVIGQGVTMGGQVGIADHVKIADGVMIAAKTGVTGNIDKRGIVAGIPHTGIREWRKSWVIFRNLEKYIDRIKVLEEKIREMEEK
jgi:UDP-3-O-[3-hydroxymyristoyl] glucosamine N-acyltransferase